MRGLKIDATGMLSIYNYYVLQKTISADIGLHSAYYKNGIKKSSTGTWNSWEALMIYFCSWCNDNKEYLMIVRFGILIITGINSTIDTQDDTGERTEKTRDTREKRNHISRGKKSSFSLLPRKGVLQLHLKSTS